MRSLLFTPTGLTSKQIGFTTEVVEDLQKKGVELMIIKCNGILNNCFFNKSHNPIACASCQSREDKILSFAGIKKDHIFSLQKHYTPPPSSHETFNTTNKLKHLTYRGINIGKGVVSSIISHTRDFDITSRKYDFIIRNEILKAKNVTTHFIELIEEWHPESIYLFNGRFSEVYPLYELAIQYKIPFYCIEAGAQLNYHLFKNCLPHSIIGRTKIINDIWSTTSNNERTQKAVDFFESKRRGSEQYEKSYTKDQQKNILPDRFNSQQVNIAIFNSSEDEVKTIDEWQHDLYETQNDAIRKLCSALKSHKNIHLFLRVHPNLEQVKNRQLEEIGEMHFNNLTIIPASSKISSYSLMDVCDKILTFGSTMGVEATFWGKVSVLFGKSYYMNLDCCYMPQTIEKLVEVLTDSTIQQKPKNSSFPYGLFLTSYGTKAEHFSFDGLDNSFYKKHKIKKFYPSTIIYLFKYLKYFRHWVKLHRVYYKKALNFKDIFIYK